MTPPPSHMVQRCMACFHKLTRTRLIGAFFSYCFPLISPVSCMQWVQWVLQKKKDQHIWCCGTTGLCKVKSFFKDFWDMHFGLLKTMFSPQNIFHSQKLYHAEKTRVNHRVAFHQTKVVAGCQKKVSNDENVDKVPGSMCKHRTKGCQRKVFSRNSTTSFPSTFLSLSLFWAISSSFLLPETTFWRRTSSLIGCQWIQMFFFARQNDYSVLTIYKISFTFLFFTIWAKKKETYLYIFFITHFASASRGFESWERKEKKIVWKTRRKYQDSSAQCQSTTSVGVLFSGISLENARDFAADLFSFPAF